jgi:hypothetical protein
VANFEPKYDDAQREAIERAYVDEQLRPSLIVQLAAMGELKHEGQPVSPFEIPYNSARYIGDRAKKRREGKLASALVNLPPRDAIETMRRRFASMIDHELSRYEKARCKPNAKPSTTKDLDVLLRLIRLVREFAALPGPEDMRLPRKPGERLEDGSQPPEGTLRQNELTRQILRAGTAGYAPANGAGQN